MFRPYKNERFRKTNYDEYIQALEECKEVAEQEAINCDKEINNIRLVLKDSHISLNKFIEYSKDLGEVRDEELIALLESLNKIISMNLDSGLSNIENSIEKKRKNLSNFTVTLFGRTKAGKSTIREALTNGDGKSIGKGGQRTTRDIKEYYWNNLRIIDTPGISAYEGEDDEKIAESIIDETDLILFLVTNDTIQESEFEKLMQLNSQNKPIIILLNVKQDIEKRVYRKKFLENYKDIVSHAGQAGHIDRIREYSKKYLGNKNFEIIVIHALSAFESTKVDDEDLKKELYNASNINKLKFVLRELIVKQGKQKRVLSFRDDFIFYLNSLESIYWESYKEIKPRLQYIKLKHSEVKKWFIDFKSRGNVTINSEVSKIFTELSLEVDSFVDMYAGNKDAEAIWKRNFESYNILGQVNKIYEELFNEAKRYLNEISRQILYEANNIKFNNDIGDIGDLKKGVIGKVARWGGVALDVAFVFSITNLWNLAGWVAGLIGIGGVVLTVFSWIGGSDSGNYDKKKTRVKNDMKRQIKKMEKDTNKQLGKAFKKNILDNLYSQINIILAKKIDLLYQYLNIIKESALKIRNEINKENIDLFKIIYRLTYEKSYVSNMIRIAREQGRMFKILTNEDEMLKVKNSRILLEDVFGERIIYVEFINEPNELLSRALSPAETDNVIFEINIPNITIKAEKEKLGQIIGQNGRNIRLTNRLFDDLIINVEEIDYGTSKVFNV